MINIKQKQLCCGCEACVQVCSKQCITLEEDKEGFLYPYVDAFLCVDCGLCEKVCPVINQSTPNESIAVYTAVNPNEEIRRQSSSGGIFTLLSETVIAESGVVFGARFDEHWDVIHDYTETYEGLAVFRGSKYVQSRIGDVYSQVKQFVKAGRKVMFTGTPCQVKGLKQYLCREYDNLLTVDFVCHGVPSPKVWRTYLNEEITRQCEEKKTVSSHFNSSFFERDALVKGISFRNKAFGWKKYSFVLTLSKTVATGDKKIVSSSCIFYDNAYMQAFLANFSLRPSCYNCPAKAGKSDSDIMIGDFWGINNIMPDFDDDRGCSLVILNSNRGEAVFSRLNINYKKVLYAEVVSNNSNIEVSVTEPPYRKLFMILFSRFGFKMAHRVLFSKNIIYKVLRCIWLQTCKMP